MGKICLQCLFQFDHGLVMVVELKFWFSVFLKAGTALRKWT